MMKKKEGVDIVVEIGGIKTPEAADLVNEINRSIITQIDLVRAVQ